ncbi:MAG: 50S ribosomal protein L32 [Candidatus Buchananbacteria bacterium RIFCSPHIGHO2_01_FULL_39_14]|uniref:Large ribosomal subunit protein bL32 n=2 Tax=Candidatus Buchananiibacteriota TaxID=1817903 RepID=A0A1G1YWC3_9BACT|nr:MAG: 50S ribosomal protein L32 [Candidatus Buchananbacteria bacterium RIFCSPHIGHO2_01_FULL_39_14]OGY49399.1 MAG: 50S ribosomal protein L32 [Candidatus Buchananbacteria bacterium RIFCSPHIGHO2_02_FULL_39_17]OGY55697.1 MAG: 50S ribosomal protein L32 [Candidatus Buchananbacteria bacterium RIFCSPLOWO2_01_FULL_40_23b]
MPVPAKRRSKSKGRRNRAHQALTTLHLIKCQKCGKPALPHRVCPACGTYQGREVIKFNPPAGRKKTKTAEHKHH